jgi:hypothetical protein
MNEVEQCKPKAPRDQQGNVIGQFRYDVNGADHALELTGILYRLSRAFSVYALALGQNPTRHIFWTKSLPSAAEHPPDAETIVVALETGAERETAG